MPEFLCRASSVSVLAGFPPKDCVNDKLRNFVAGVLMAGSCFDYYLSSIRFRIRHAIIPLIGYQRGAAIDNWRRIIATIVEEGNFCSDTINYIVNPKDYELYAVLALLNSSLWEWRFRLTSTNNHVNAYEIDSMPMPRISFTTPEKERKERVDAAIELYEKYMVELV